MPLSFVPIEERHFWKQSPKNFPSSEFLVGIVYGNEQQYEVTLKNWK